MSAAPTINKVRFVVIDHVSIADFFGKTDFIITSNGSDTHRPNVLEPLACYSALTLLFAEYFRLGYDFGFLVRTWSRMKGVQRV